MHHTYIQTQTPHVYTTHVYTFPFPFPFPPLAGFGPSPAPSPAEEDEYSDYYFGEAPAPPCPPSGASDVAFNMGPNSGAGVPSSVSSVGNVAAVV